MVLLYNQHITGSVRWESYGSLNLLYNLSSKQSTKTHLVLSVLKPFEKCPINNRFGSKVESGIFNH